MPPDDPLNGNQVELGTGNDNLSVPDDLLRVIWWCVSDAGISLGQRTIDPAVLSDNLPIPTHLEGDFFGYQPTDRRQRVPRQGAAGQLLPVWPGHGFFALNERDEHSMSFFSEAECTAQVVSRAGMAAPGRQSTAVNQFRLLFNLGMTFAATESG